MRVKMGQKCSKNIRDVNQGSKGCSIRFVSRSRAIIKDGRPLPKSDVRYKSCPFLSEPRQSDKQKTNVPHSECDPLWNSSLPGRSRKPVWQKFLPDISPINASRSFFPANFAKWGFLSPNRVIYRGLPGRAANLFFISLLTPPLLNHPPTCFQIYWKHNCFQI